MTRAPASFVPRVVTMPTFQRSGLAFGRLRHDGLPLHWVVIDPARHRMFMWQKPGLSFVSGARALNASVVTNGPFTNYASGGGVRSSAAALRDIALRRAVPRDALRTRLVATVPLGHVRSDASCLHETAVDRPRVFHFGRTGGSTFDDYRIGVGDPPPSLVEAVGGLFGCVVGHQPSAVRQFRLTGYWGLVPLRDNPILADVAGTPLEGVIVFLGGWGSTRRLAQFFAALGVRDGVRIDGGDSLFFSVRNQVRIGRVMPPWKRLLQCWGIAFAEAEAAGL